MTSHIHWLNRQCLHYCLREHHQALKNGDLGSSALAEHVFLSNHQVNLFNLSVSFLASAADWLRWIYLVTQVYIVFFKSTLGHEQLPNFTASLTEWTRGSELANASTVRVLLYQLEMGWKLCRHFNQNALAFRAKMVTSQEHIQFTATLDFSCHHDLLEVHQRVS